MKKLAVLAGVILIMSFASAASVDYQIFGNRVLVEADFGEVSDFEFRLPYDAETIESKSDFEVIDYNNYKILKVNSSKNFSFSYITEIMVEKSSRKNFFIMKNYYNKPLNVRLYLPEAGVLMEDFSLIFPEDAHIDTDGRRVFLEWKNFSNDEIVVGYEIVSETNNIYFYLFLLIIAGFILFYWKNSRDLKEKVKNLKKRVKVSKESSKKKKKENITRNLFGEEKQIIEYLIEKKGNECWTKEIARDLNISKVRLSRKLRNLEQKELIYKEPYGNENRIRLIKTS